MKTFKFFALLGMFICMAFTSVFAQDAKANIKSAYESLNKRDYAAFTKLVTPDFVEYAAGAEPAKTPEAAIEAYKMFFAAFPDLKFQIQDISAGMNGQYYVKTMVTGTNTGSFNGLPPTGKKVSQADVDIVVINSKGLATSHWSANPNGLLTSIGYGSMTNPNTAVIADLYDKFSKGDLPGILDECTDDVVFEVHDNVLYAIPMFYKGKIGVSEFFKDLTAKNQYTKFQPWRFMADGDDVIVLVHVEFNNLPTGHMYNTNYVHQFKVVNGKITNFKGVSDIQQPEPMTK